MDHMKRLLLRSLPGKTRLTVGLPGAEFEDAIFHMEWHFVGYLLDQAAESRHFLGGAGNNVRLLAVEPGGMAALVNLRHR